MRAMNIKDRVAAIIRRQQQTLQDEIEMYRRKLRETESYWGCGGPYNRQETAIEKREKQLEELNDFEMQLKYVEKHQDAHMYIFGCKHCGSITMVNQQPFDDWHECPVCRNMVYLKNLKPTNFRIVDTGENWMKQLRKLAQGDQE